MRRSSSIFSAYLRSRAASISCPRRMPSISAVTAPSEAPPSEEMLCGGRTPVAMATAETGLRRASVCSRIVLKIQGFCAAVRVAPLLADPSPEQAGVPRVALGLVG